MKMGDKRPLNSASPSPGGFLEEAPFHCGRSLNPLGGGNLDLTLMVNVMDAVAP